MSRVIGFGLIGGVAMGIAGGMGGVVAFYIFRAIDLALYPHYGTFVMTALSSQLPVVLTAAGLLFGAIGMACFGNSRPAQENAKEALIALVRNALIGVGIGSVVGGISGLIVGRMQSPEDTTFFTTFFAGVVFGFVLGLIGALITSVKRQQAASGAAR